LYYIELEWGKEGLLQYMFYFGREGGLTSYKLLYDCNVCHGWLLTDREEYYLGHQHLDGIKAIYMQFSHPRAFQY